MYNNHQASNRWYPNVAIHQVPVEHIDSSGAISPYAFEVTPPAGDLNPWEQLEEATSPLPSEWPARPRSRTTSAFGPSTSNLAFPEPHIFRSTSHRTTLHPNRPLQHRSSKSDEALNIGLHRDTSLSSFRSTASSYSPSPVDDDVQTTFSSHDDLSHELSNLSLDSEEGLRRFQAGELREEDEEWHRLVPAEAQESLGKKEVQRQSVIFEVFKSERGYVQDLEAVKEVFIEPLRNANPPVIPSNRCAGFISEVFWNLDRILAHHQRMLAALLARQREQHPLVQSVADIVLDTTLIFCPEYESYIKHYPLAEARHRTEVKRNRQYQAFIQSCSLDPRIRKRDLITFLSRPVTRLPRLSLVLEHINKLTDQGHEDVDTIPLILGILSDFIKSTQPGIEAAEGKVKFWSLCETLVYQKGEIIDMDLYDDSRTLVHSGPLARRQRSETDWHGWNDLNVALLDNFLIITREETRPNGAIKRHVVSRPIPLPYLRLGAFDSPPESRKMRADDGRILESLRHYYVQLYPFTVYHASSKSSRRYTLFANSESARKKWHEKLVDAIGVNMAIGDANMWFAPHSLSDRYFRSTDNRTAYNSGTRFTGKITSAAPFTSGNRGYIAVGCQSGIYLATRGESPFRKVLSIPNATSLIALQSFNKFLVHFDNTLLSYSLDLMARVARGEAPGASLSASKEEVAGPGGDGNVLFFRVGIVGGRTMIIYAIKTFLQVTLHTLEAVHPSEVSTATRRGTIKALSFRPIGKPISVPKEVHGITPLIKTVAIQNEKDFVIVDLANIERSSVAIVPDFSQANTNDGIANLKNRIDSARALGMVRSDASELLVIYDILGCYISKHGAPNRQAGYVRWESRATSYAHHGAHILLFSSQFIEVRNISSGRLVQVIEAEDVRLLHQPQSKVTEDAILAVMKGRMDDKDGISEKLVELAETSEIAASPTTAATTSANGSVFWDEWDL